MSAVILFDDQLVGSVTGNKTRLMSYRFTLDVMRIQCCRTCVSNVTVGAGR